MTTLPATTIEQMREVYERISNIHPESQISLTMRKRYGGDEVETYFYVSVGVLTDPDNGIGINADPIKAEVEAVEKFGSTESRRATQIHKIREQAEKLGLVVMEVGPLLSE